MQYYAGIGSRETDQETLKLMEQIGYFLSKDYTLRSGGAIGADSAFERGCDKGKGKKEIFYAKEGKGTPIPPEILIQAREIAASVHPAWDRCDEYARKLHTRNACQILGADLQSPVEFVICWTKNGGFTGGTATAMRIAERTGIKILNLFDGRTRLQIIKRVAQQK